MDKIKNIKCYSLKYQNQKNIQKGAVKPTSPTISYNLPKFTTRKNNLKQIAQY